MRTIKLIERLEKFILYRIVNGHMAVLEEISAMLPEDKSREIKELIGDYEITKKVFDTYYSMPVGD